MKRSVNNSTLLGQTTNEEYSITQNYCPLPPKNIPKNNQEQELKMKKPKNYCVDIRNWL